MASNPSSFRNEFAPFINNGFLQKKFTTVQECLRLLNPSHRHKRQERRDKMAALMIYLTAHADYSDMSLSWHTITKIAKKLGVSVRSMLYAARELKRLGWIHYITERVQTDSGIRTIQTKIFIKNAFFDAVNFIRSRLQRLKYWGLKKKADRKARIGVNKYAKRGIEILKTSLTAFDNGKKSGTDAYIINKSAQKMTKTMATAGSAIASFVKKPIKVVTEDLVNRRQLWTNRVAMLRKEGMSINDIVKKLGSCPTA